MLSLSAAAASENLGGVPAAVQDVPYWHLVEESAAAEAQGRLHHERQVGKCTDGATICATFGSMRRPFRPFD